MLPLWTNRCLMSISAIGVAMVEISSITQNIVEKQFYPFGDLHNPDQQNINQIVNVILEKHRKSKRQKLQVILSSDFIRFMVLPAQSKYLNNSDRWALANALYREVYGSLCENWMIEFDDSPPYESTLCAAIDIGLIDHLKMSASHHNFVLTSVVPYATTLINQLNLSAFHGYVALIEPARLVFVEFNETLLNIQQVKCRNGWINPLQQILKKTELFSSLDSKKLIICSPQKNELNLSEFDDWQISFAKTHHLIQEGETDYQMILGGL